MSSSHSWQIDNPEGCRPLVCPFPYPGKRPIGSKWTCPNCGTRYVIVPKPAEWKSSA